MKKLLLAVAVSVAAGSASAATIYEGNGLTYKINGDVQIQLRKKVGEDEHADVEFDDIELKNYVSYDLGSDMKAFGRVDFSFDDKANDSGDDSADLEEAYVGLALGNTSVSIGKQNFASDEFGIEEAYELISDEDRFDGVETSGDDTIRLDIELENVYIAASYELQAKGSDNSSSGKYFDLFASTDIGNVTLAAAYQNTSDADEDFIYKNGADDVDTWGFSASYDAGFATFAAEYSTTDDLADQYGIATTFAVAETTTVAIGVIDTDFDDAYIAKFSTPDDIIEDFTEWYANVTYKFPTQKNVSLFAEIADTDLDDSDMGYLAGMRVKF